MVGCLHGFSKLSQSQAIYQMIPANPVNEDQEIRLTWSFENFLSNLKVEKTYRQLSKRRHSIWILNDLKPMVHHGCPWLVLTVEVEARCPTETITQYTRYGHAHHQSSIRSTESDSLQWQSSALEYGDVHLSSGLRQIIWHFKKVTF